ncbi:TetR/AcrR family transcriptional regulator [Streptomyces purpurogeneiscleroticus]|uniref:TetR/AcrR family transcriptional regulator n=1 Tax=Streptomyces purpurogeneiscleroticus TaxID=68259 RepID=UPI001CBD2527|nr:TetR/AcrR family transcriptional regulator [Streptomyces purpurogeneiscleroticus]
MDGSRVKAKDDTGERPARARKNSAADTRSALMAAAALRFGRYGYDGASIRDIAGDAGVDAALVYRYFGSKEALFASVSMDTAIFDSLLEVPLDEVAAWVSDFVTNGPPDEEIPHPVLSVLRSSSREDAVRQFRDNVAEVFSGRFAERLEGPDAELRAELLAAWLLGTSLMRKAFRTPALDAATTAALESHLRAGITGLLNPRTCECGCTCPCGV